MGEIYSAALYDYVYVVAGASEETVPHISAYGKCAHAPFACHFAYDSEDVFLDVLRCYCGHCSLIC